MITAQLLASARSVALVPSRVSPKFLQESGAFRRIREDSRALDETAKAEEFSNPAVKDERHRVVGETLSAVFESLLPLCNRRVDVPEEEAG